jgi:hypothetical protein
VDDAIVIPLLVSWIVGMLPRRAPAYTRQDGSPIIDGDYRRL